jgi:integrase
MATSLSILISDTSGCVIFRRLSIAPVSGHPWEDFQLNHLVLAFLVAARFADPIVSLQPYQFARDSVNAVRDIDVAPELANAVKRYIASQDFNRSTYLFQTRGKPLSHRNVLRDSLYPILKKIGRQKCGFHIFRRFRASWLRKNRVPWDLEKIWMGHAHKDLTDQYAEQLPEDVKYRHKWCEEIGLGFILPANVSQLSQRKSKAVTSRKAA